MSRTAAAFALARPDVFAKPRGLRRWGTLIAWILSLGLGLGCAMPAQAADVPAHLLYARENHTATLLPDGRLLIVGGGYGEASYRAELYDPSTNAWTDAGRMAGGRRNHTATLLANGMVLVVGGLGSSAALASAEAYNPATNSWSAVQAPNYARHSHTATRLANGKVLIVGGTQATYSDGKVFAENESELYDPATGSWMVLSNIPATGVLTPRTSHTATLLADGNVLVTGGYRFLSGSSPVAAHSNAVLFETATGNWLSAGTLSSAHFGHSATLLANGNVLVAAGYGDGYRRLSAVAERYDPSTRQWTTVTPLLNARAMHSATLLANGHVLMAGGVAPYYGVVTATAELYDPQSNTWTATDALANGRSSHTATRLKNGTVFVAGGSGIDAPSPFPYSATGGALDSAEVFDPYSSRWTSGPAYGALRYAHAATALRDGKVLVTGGIDGGFLATAELYDPWTDGWTRTASLAGPRAYHTSTLLANGKVLITGGQQPEKKFASAELYDPAAGAWTAAAPLAASRSWHTATLLADGKVLVAGGSDTAALASAELYDPAANTWTAAGTLAVGRFAHTATRLPNGKVLVIGGMAASGTLPGAELFDPATRTWSPAAQPSYGRVGHTSVLLPNGTVLAVGGAPGVPPAAAEIYDPAANAWKSVAPPLTARSGHTATLLSNGTVAIAGGCSANNCSPLASVELYDPATDTWSVAGSLAGTRTDHVAIPLPNGKVLVAGGFAGVPGYDSRLGHGELLDPLSNPFVPARSLSEPRRSHKTVLLPDGKVLMVPGTMESGALTNTSTYDPSTDAWTPAGMLSTWARTATALPNGKVLVTLDTASILYDSATRAWSSAVVLIAGMNNLVGHSATRLADGRVLVTGRSVDRIPYAALYDPAANAWSPASVPADGCVPLLAVLVPNGKVLGIGASGATGPSCASSFDPATNSWTPAAALSTARFFQTATLLPTGKVLCLASDEGWSNSDGPLTVAGLYDPGTDAWTAASPPSGVRSGASVTLLPDGTILVAGGSIGDHAGSSLASAELYDPVRDLWMPAGTMILPRAAHSSVLLANGKVLLTGGEQRVHEQIVSITKPTAVTATSEIYDPTRVLNYSDSWWNANESGWGLSITDHGANAFVQWYTYDQSGHNQKYVMSGGSYANGKCSFSGTLWHVTGPSWNSASFDPGQVVRTQAGSATIDFCPAGMAAGSLVFNYSADGVSGSKPLTRLPYGNDAPHWGGAANGGIDYTDLWWNPAESGWGASIAQHGNNLFLRIFTYDIDNRPLLFVMSGGAFTSPTSFTGILQQTSGPWLGTAPFDPGNVVRTTVGSATLTFSDAVTGVLSYSVNGVTKTKVIARMQF